jgi:hypothetical protein
MWGDILRKITLFVALTLVIVGFMSIFIPNVTAQSLPETEYDPQNDVKQSDPGGTFKTATSKPNIDIIQMVVDEDTGISPGPLDDNFDFSITVDGTIQNDNDIQYVAIVSVSTETYLLQYRNNVASGYKMSDGSNFVVASSISSNTLTLTASQTAIPSISGLALYTGAVETDSEDNRFVDIAPDKLILIKSPNDQSTVYTISDPLTVSGTTQWWDPNVYPVNVQYRIDGGGAWNTASTSDGGRTWSFTWDTTSLSGSHTIETRASGGGLTVTDSVTVTVNQNYVTQANRPVIQTGPTAHLGDHYEYKELQSGDLISLDLGAATDMTLDVVVQETVNVDGTNYDTYRFEIHQEGEASAGSGATSLSIVTTTDRTSWKRDDDQAVVKDYTYTKVDVEGPVPYDSVETKVNASYNPPQNVYEFPMRVGIEDRWTVSSSVTKNAQVKQQNEPWDTKPETTEQRTIISEALKEETINVFGTQYDTFLVRHGEEETGLLTIEYYNEDVGAPVRIDTFDTNRRLIGSLGLKAHGTIFIEVQSIESDPAEPKKGEEATVTITVRNSGTIALTSAQQITLKDGSTTIGTASI